jgi:hypothetical protein
MPRPTTRAPHLVSTGRGVVRCSSLAEARDEAAYWKGRGFKGMVLEFAYRPHKRRWDYVVVPDV